MINKLINEIKKKKELSDIDHIFIKKILNNYIKKYNINIEKLREKQIKTLTKEIRAKLRMFIGRFQKNPKSRLKFLEENKIEEILNTHVSTKERISIYPEIKKIIEKLNVKSILDLGCGLNPLVLAKKGIKYYAVDIKKEELDLIKKFFTKNNINGEVFSFDIKNFNTQFPKTDLIILFKILDIISDKGHRTARKIINLSSCRYILISFSTKTLSGKPMKYIKRMWLERILNRENYKYKIISFYNEIFYLIDKSKQN